MSDSKLSNTENTNRRLEEAMRKSLGKVEEKTEKDKRDRAAENALAEEEHKAKIRGLVESNLDRKANRRLRWKYAKWVFQYLVGYSIACFILLVLHGFSLWFTLPESVLDFLVGSTAVSAIGLVAAVVTGLFRK